MKKRTYYNNNKQRLSFKKNKIVHKNFRNETWKNFLLATLEAENVPVSRRANRPYIQPDGPTYKWTSGTAGE